VGGAVTPDLIKRLRGQTGAGIMDCRKALEEAAGDLDKALLLLRERGIASAAKKLDRVAEEGAITAYIHHGGKLGAMVEVNCETDFVARNEEFQALARELAMQIAAMRPKWVAKEDVPAEWLAARQAEFRDQAKELGRPVDAFVAERTEQLLSQVCLLEQPYIRDAGQTIQALVMEKIAKFGERIRIKRFTVYNLGDAAEDGAATSA
jgi:elongation factor Ts